MTLFCKSIAALTALVGLVATASAQNLYQVEDLGTLQGDFESMPWGINAKGDVVGSSTGPEGMRAFIFTDQTGMVELESVSKGSLSVARDINDFGEVVGQSNFRAVKWDVWSAREPFSGARYLDTDDRVSEATAVNNLGEAVGWSEPKRSLGWLERDARHAAYFSEAAGRSDITGSGYAEAADISDSGAVAGTQNGTAFLWQQGGKIRALGELEGFGYLSANGVNELAEIVGGAINQKLTLQKAFIFTPGIGLKALEGIGDTNVLRRINNKSVAVGQGRLQDGLLQGLIYSPADGIQGLNALITSPQDWFIEYATDINDAGVIIASAWSAKKRVRHAVRLVPTLEGGGCPIHCARSTEIVMSAELTREASTITATVLVADEQGVPLADVEVTAILGIPDQSAREVTAVGQTDAKGHVRFEMSGGSGTYRISIQDLSKPGYTFDPSNSELQNSIDL